MDLHPDPTIAARLERFAAAIDASPHNLMSRQGRAELRSRHLPESVAFADLLPRGPARLLDVGSGGGLPGLVIATTRPDLEVHLLEATSKKVAFLRSTASGLGLTVEVHHGRAEDLQRRSELSGHFDLVTARAVAALERLVGWTVPFLRVGGLLYAIKGERWDAELADAEGALRRTGATVVATPEQTRSPAAEDATAASPRVVILARSH